MIDNEVANDHCNCCSMPRMTIVIRVILFIPIAALSHDFVILISGITLKLLALRYRADKSAEWFKTEALLLFKVPITFFVA